MVDDLAAYVKKSRSDATFLRIVASPQAQCLPCSEAVAYDRTVMLDLKGDEDSDVLARMKNEGDATCGKPCARSIRVPFTPIPL